MTEEQIDDIVYFLRKSNLKSLQRAQLILNAAVEKQYWEESDVNQCWFPLEETAE